MTDTNICPVCGREFIPKPNQIYCSSNCKSAVYWRKQEERKNTIERLEKEADWLANALESFVEPKQPASHWREQAAYFAKEGR